ncbi:hypothetical protein ACTXT7_013975 [Hymenolepis weldensis]
MSVSGTWCVRTPPMSVYTRLWCVHGSYGTTVAPGDGAYMRAKGRHMTVKHIRLLGGANDFHVTALALSPDSESFVTFCEDGTLRLWSLSHNLEYQILTRQSDLDRQSLHERTLAWVPCGQLLACSLGDHRLKIWNQTHLSKGSLVSLCTSAIRRHVVSGLCAGNPVSSCCQSAANEGSALTALSALPLPRPLRSLLCRDLEAGNSVTTATTATVSAKL